MKSTHASTTFLQRNALLTRQSTNLTFSENFIFKIPFWTLFQTQIFIQVIPCLTWQAPFPITTRLTLDFTQLTYPIYCLNITIHSNRTFYQTFFLDRIKKIPILTFLNTLLILNKITSVFTFYTFFILIT